MKNILLDRYKKFSAPAKASFWFVFSNVLLKGISFITLPIFSRLLTPSDYGTVSVYHSWVSIITIFCTLTLWGGVYNIVLVKNPEKRDKYVSAFQGLATFLTLCFLMVSCIFIKPFSSFTTMSPFLTICMYLDILSSIPFNLWAGKQRFEYKYKMLVIITIIISILNPLIAYFVVINTEHKAEARIVTGVILNCIVGLFFCIYNLKRDKTLFSKEIWTYALKFNLVLIPHYLSMQVLSQSDRLMINKLCNSGEAGIYSIAYTFAMLLSLITNGISSSFTPFSYLCIKEEKFEKLRKSTNSLLMGLVIVTVFVICLIPDIFKLMLPESYYDAIWVIPPVAGSVYFMFLYPLFSNVELYFEKKKYISIASFLCAIVNIILNYIFISKFGYIAAAYTTLACYILISIFHCMAMNYVLKKQNMKYKIYDLKIMSIVSVILVCCVIGITYLYKNIFIRWSIISIIILVAFIFRKKIISFVKNLR